MKIYIISNTEFGHKNHKSFINYFIKDFIPYIQNYSSKDDILLHMGGLFNNKSFNITTIGVDVFNIFNELSNYLNVKFVVSEKDRTISNNSNTMLMFENHQKIKIIKKRKYYDNFEIIPYIDKLGDINSKNIIFYDNSIILNNKKRKFNPPYQLSEKDKNKRVGFYIFDTETKKITLKENNFSKRYINIEINNEDDLKSLKKEDFENYVNLNINTNFYNKNENKVNVNLSKFKVDKVSYFDNDNGDDEKELDSNLENNIINEINKLDNSVYILEEFNKIYEIYKEKYKN